MVVPGDRQTMITRLREDFDHYESLVDRTYVELESAKDRDTWQDAVDRHMVFGRQYHSTANRLKILTGVDPRPVP